MRSPSFMFLTCALVPAAIGCAAHRSGDDRAIAGPNAGLTAALAGDASHPASEPRCQPTDPACGPEPFGRRSLEQSFYVAEWPRIADLPASDPHPQNTLACAHDGECFDSGCGYACLSTRDPHFLELECIALADEASRLRDHYCGCVRGLCRWFTQ